MTATTKRTCPTCNQSLEGVRHEGLELDRCPAGHGCWLDRGELRAVALSEEADRPVEEERAALARAAADGGRAVVAELDHARRACPVCGSQMRLTEYAGSGIPIDECSEHGTWLDQGELERIEAFAEGIRAQARGGAAGDATRVAGTTVSGIDVPADLLASIRVAVPPPR